MLFRVVIITSKFDHTLLIKLSSKIAVANKSINESYVVHLKLI